MPQRRRRKRVPDRPHEVATGAECDGCLIIEERGEVADLKCNSCGAVVDTVPLDRVGTRLMELASDEILLRVVSALRDAEHLPRLQRHRRVYLPEMRRRGERRAAYSVIRL
jgi:hypothetical protein